MKTRTIKKILNSKFNRFVASIEDPEVNVLVRDNSMITGGAIASMLLQEDVADFDIYFRDRETALAVANYYVDKFQTLGGKARSNFSDENATKIFVDDSCSERIRIVVKSAGVAALEDQGGYQYFEMNSPEDSSVDNYVDTAIQSSKKRENKGKYIPIFLSGNAITLSDKVQLILRFWGEPEEIHKNYDYIHCTNVWTSWDNKLHLNPEALECLLTKELRYFGSRYPIASIIRSRKFIQRGWKITAGQYLKMVLQCQELDLTNPSVLMDQLMGVDLAYFYDLVRKLAEMDTNNIDSNYLIQLIDELTW